MAGGLRPARPRAARRRAALLAVVTAVVGAHLLVSRDLSARFDELRSTAAMPARIDVTYVNEMKQTAPVISTAPMAAPEPEALAAATSALAAEAAASQAEAVEREAARAKEAQRKAAKAKVKADRLKAQRLARAEAKARDDREARAAAEKLDLEARALAAVRAAQAASGASQPESDAGQALADASRTSAASAATVSEAASSSAPSPSASAATPALASRSAPVAGANAASDGSTVASADPSSADAATASDPAASGARPFEWPVSTRVSYVLTGYYRGDVQGWAKVEWVKAGSRYQVHLDVTIGPDFAPIIYRRMSSDGEITPAGLSPRRYDEETKVVFRDVRRNTVILDRDDVTLPDGSRHDRRPNMQDQASQFVQLTYLFSTRPGLLTPGRIITLPLALPRRIDDWQYEVMENEAVAAPFGSVPAVHVRPRRSSGESTGSTGNELTAEVWFAPTLAYLPVRIRIQQVGDNFLDLVIAKPPEQASR